MAPFLGAIKHQRLARRLKGLKYTVSRYRMEPPVGLEFDMSPEEIEERIGTAGESVIRNSSSRSGCYGYLYYPARNLKIKIERNQVQEFIFTKGY